MITGIGTVYAESREEMIQSLSKGVEFRNGKNTFILLPGMKSIKSASYTTNTLPRFSTSHHPPMKSVQQRDLSTTIAENVIEQKGNFLILREGSLQELRQSRSVAAIEKSYPVVLNRSTGQFGVVTGQLIVKLKNIEDASRLAEEHNLKIKNIFRPIQYVYYTTTGDLFQTLRKLKGLPEIREATLDILESINQAH